MGLAVDGSEGGGAQVEEIQAELAAGFDSLVVGGSLDPALLVPRLLPFLKPSSPLAVYCATPQPLMELEQLLIQVCASHVAACRHRRCSCGACGACSPASCSASAASCHSPACRAGLQRR